MTNKTEHNQAVPSESASLGSRRDAARKLGKFAAYAAPVTLLALTKKADAATGHGPIKH